MSRVKRIKALLDHFPPGYSLRMSGSGHYLLLDDKGLPARLTDGRPVVFSATPSDSQRGDLNTIKRAQRDLGIR